LLNHQLSYHFGIGIIGFLWGATVNKLISIVVVMPYLKINRRLHVFLSICLFACLTSVQGQDKDRLETQKQYLIQQINEAEKVLAKKNKDKVSREEVLNSMTKKIVARQSLLSNLKKQAKNLQAQIETTTFNIENLEGNIEVLRTEYASMVRAAYKGKNDFNYWLFLLSADSFNRIIKRLQYLNQYTNYREKQYRLIKDNIAHLSKEKASLEKAKAEQDALIAEEQKQHNQLESERSKQGELVQQIVSEAQQIKQDIDKKKSAAKKLESEIASIIKKEIEAARAKTKGSKKRAADYLNVTPEAKALSSNFEANRGKLPWPVSEGYISDTFGKKAHAYLKGIQTNNNGIDISTNPNAKVKALFNGEVVNVVFNPGFQAAIIVKHGKYFTVYSNIKEAVVKTGDKVSTGETIGTVYTDTKENKTEVHLEIWNGNRKMNPGSWLVK